MPGRDGAEPIGRHVVLSPFAGLKPASVPFCDVWSNVRKKIKGNPRGFSPGPSFLAFEIP